MTGLDGPAGSRSGAAIVIPDLRQETVRLAMATGAFNLMWAIWRASTLGAA